MLSDYPDVSCPHSETSEMKKSDESNCDQTYPFEANESSDEILEAAQASQFVASRIQRPKYETERVVPLDSISHAHSLTQPEPPSLRLVHSENDLYGNEGRNSHVARGEKILSAAFLVNITKLQRKVRSWMYDERHKLHRKNLGDRLVFEADLWKGVKRLFRQVLIFVMIMITLNVATERTSSRGISKDILSNLALDGDSSNLIHPANRNDFFCSIGQRIDSGDALLFASSTV